MCKPGDGVEMTNKKSQVTIPVNASTLFTSVVGFIVIAMLAYMFEMPKKLDDNIAATKTLADNVEKIVKGKELTDSFVADHEKRIQSIEDTRFTRADAEDLQRRTVDSITQALQPIAQGISRNERDIIKLEEEIDDLERQTIHK